MARHTLLATLSLILLLICSQLCRGDVEAQAGMGNIEKDVLILTDKTVNATIQKGSSVLLVRRWKTGNKQITMHRHVCNL